jgi:polyhydroxyalkanoate synthesis regulator phasin
MPAAADVLNTMEEPTMTERANDTSNMFDPFGAMQSVRDANIEAWSKIMQQWVNTEAYAEANSKMLDAYLTTSAPFRTVIEQTMTRVLQQFNMPTRTDVTGIAERLTNLEKRLDDLDAQLEGLRRAAGPKSAPESGSKK